MPVFNFIECEFPRKLALMAIGGPGYFTSVNAGFSGYEQRNSNWAQARAQYAVSFENKPLSEWTALEGMFHAARGMANGFRLFDPGDYLGVGQFQAQGDGLTTVFQMQKTYAFPISDYEVIRPVQKLITSRVVDFDGDYLTDTVEVYLNGTKQTHNSGYVSGGGVQFTLDENTGLITFANPPGLGVVITADYQYHIPVRFDLQGGGSSTASTEGALQKQYVTGVNVPGGIQVTVSGMNLVEIRIKPGFAS